MAATHYSATPDPATVRALAALFHFMQGKELASQEQAWGCLQLASDSFHAQAAEQIQRLAQEQTHCFEAFARFADRTVLQQWQDTVVPCCHQELQQMRVLLTTPCTTLPHHTALCEQWFALCNQRLDAMKTVENALRDVLLNLAQSQAQHVHALRRQLDQAQTALEERKVVERAKGLLMQHRRLPEDAAYSLLRKTAMNQGRKLADVARTVLAMADTQK